MMTSPSPHDLREAPSPGTVALRARAPTEELGSGHKRPVHSWALRKNIALNEATACVWAHQPFRFSVRAPTPAFHAAS